MWRLKENKRPERTIKKGRDGQSVCLKKTRVEVKKREKKPECILKNGQNGGERWPKCVLKESHSIGKNM